VRRRPAALTPLIDGIDHCRPPSMRRARGWSGEQLEAVPEKGLHR